MSTSQIIKEHLLYNNIKTFMSKTFLSTDTLLITLCTYYIQYVSIKGSHGTTRKRSHVQLVTFVCKVAILMSSIVDLNEPSCVYGLTLLLTYEVIL